MMDVILSICAFVFGLGLIILIHEFGHFIVAKKSGILCYEFSLGMGPAIYKKKIGETVYAIRAIPIGGYVSMAGEEISDALIKEGQRIGINLTSELVTEIIIDEDSVSEFSGVVESFDLYAAEGGKLYINLIIDDAVKTFEVSHDANYVLKKGEMMQIAPYERCFESKKLWQRFLSIFAGPFMNFVLGFLLYIIVGFMIGQPATNKTVLGTVSGAATNILQVGDVVKKINGVEISSWNLDDGSNTLTSELSKAIGDENIEMTVDRNGETLTLSVVPDIFVMNMGVLGKPNDVTSDGVKVQICNANGCMTKSREAGLQNDDVVTSVDGVSVRTWKDLVNVCSGIKEGRNVDVTIVRETDGVKETYSRTIEFYSEALLVSQGSAQITMQVGISPIREFNFLWAFSYGAESSADDFGVVGSTLGFLFASDEVGVNDLSGPVGIYSLVESTIKGGFANFVAFVAFLSINVGIVNLLPIPALDGGRLVFLGYELVSRRKVNRRVENTINSIMFILIMILFVYITFNDIGRLIG